MSFSVFSAVTIAGSAIWCTVLAVYGKQVLGTYAQAHPDWTRNPAGVVAFIRSQSHAILGGILLLCVNILYF